METWKRTPLELFNLPQHFVIPLFQRPYVWEQEDQWAPLWLDIVRTVERRNDPATPRAYHFLGAVVLQASEAAAGRLSEWNVIDGQQRLTTLQVLVDAAHCVFAEHGDVRQANILEGLTHNPPHFVGVGENPLKLRHLNKDREAFIEVMTLESGFDYEELEHVDSRIVRAHQYFHGAVREWLGSPDSTTYSTRAHQLTDVLQNGLQLVSIDLTPDEDSQEIFETLNARGTPLTAADLVRNFVFQRLVAEGGDSQRAYEKDWPFESAFWEAEVSVGRQFISRSSLFLNQWLISKLGHEVSPMNTFSTFKSYVDHGPVNSISGLLPKIKQQADMYQRWTEAAARPDQNLGSIEMSFYRMRASGIELLKPVIIWLTDPDKDFSDHTISDIIQVLESWIYRRQLLRLSNSSIGRTVAEIVGTNAAVTETDLLERITRQLTRLNVTSTYWPGDNEVRRTLANEPVFRRYPRARLRMFLEAIEDHFRSETRQPQVRRGTLPIEHILPQKWHEHWPVESVESELERTQRVHRLGNLTLLTSSLNSKVSNGNWLRKRDALLEHNTMSMTGRLIRETEHIVWNEASIDSRTKDLIEVIISVWPVPDGHEGTVLDPQAKAGDWIELIHLIEAGFLTPGIPLIAMHRDFRGTEAELLADGQIEMGGKKFSSPSGAGHHLRRKHTNGWHFWGLNDGRRLKDVRSEFLNTSPSHT